MEEGNSEEVHVVVEPLEGSIKFASGLGVMGKQSWD